MRICLTGLFVYAFFLLFPKDANAEDIWVEDFSENHNKGYVGSSVDMEGVTRWSLDVSNCTLSDDSDYVMVVETSGGRLQAVDCDGEAIWTSEEIDISKYESVDLSMVVAETGSSTNEQKYIRVYYRLNGGQETLWDSNSDMVGDYGTVTASHNGLKGNSIILVVRMNNPNASDAVYIDDVRIVGEPVVVPKDQNSLLEVPSVALQAKEISSENITSEKAEELFRFRLVDQISGDDGEPTRVSGIRIDNVVGDNTVSFIDCLQGVRLQVGDKEVICKSSTIEENALRFIFDDDQLVIAEDQSLEVSLYGYLKDDGIQDGKSLQFAIGGEEHGLEVYDSGSGFALSQPRVVSPVHTLQVVAIRLKITQYADNPIRDRPFSLALEGVDGQDNRDIDADMGVVLSVTDGDGILSSGMGLERSLAAGTLLWDDLRYDGIGDMNMQATGVGLEPLNLPTLSFSSVNTGMASTLRWIPEDTTINSLVTKLEHAVEVFRFNISDAGDDGRATYLKKIRIDASNLNTVDWKKQLQDVLLEEQGGRVDCDVSMEANYLELLFDDPYKQGFLEDGGTRSFSLHTFLNPGSVCDGGILHMRIDSLSGEWEVLPEGSGLSGSFGEMDDGPLFTFDVRGSLLSFLSIPKIVEYTQPFSVDVTANDVLGSVDWNEEATVSLTLASGNGVLSTVGGYERSCENGLFVWDSLVYDGADNFTLLVQSPGLESALSKTIAGVDNTSRLSVPGIQVKEGELSSLAVDAELSQSVIRFMIQDAATHDDLPTVITSLRVVNTHSDLSFPWERHLGGALLREGDNVLAKASVISEDEIRFYSTNGLLEVLSGTQRELNVSVWFRESGLPDGATFQAFIPGVNHGLRCHVSGSNFVDTLSQDVVGPILQLAVDATNLWFSDLPLAVQNNQAPWNINVVAGDIYHNVDVDAAFAVVTELVKGNGIWEAPEDKNLQKGVATLEDVIYKGDDNFTLRVSTSRGELKSDTQEVLLHDSRVWLDDDFENQELVGWISAQDWMVTSYSPIEGHFSVKHNLTQEVGKSCLMHSITGVRGDNGMLQWEVILRNGEWDPSSDNYFNYILISDHEDPAQSILTYGVGVNKFGSTDLLTLWKMDNGTSVKSLIQTHLNWNAGDEVAIQVRHTPLGKWSLRVNRMGSLENYQSVGECFHEEWPQGDSFVGICFNFGSASRAGELWIDKMSLVEVGTPPAIKDVVILSMDSLRVDFQEELDSISGSNISHYNLIRDGDTVDLKYVGWGLNFSQVVIHTAEKLITGNYILRVQAVADQQGDTLLRQEVDISYLAPPAPHDVVINEIMADDHPAVGLPEREYVELYNRTSFPVSLKGWTLQVGSHEVSLPVDTLSAFGYVVLCANSSVDLLSPYGNTLGVSGFPALKNSGNNVVLYNSQNEFMDNVTYCDQWYGAEKKREGGWSLERIDPARYHGGADNWLASEDPSGGTPGQLNSIMGLNPDVVNPWVINTELVDANSVLLQFNEPLDTVVSCGCNLFMVDQGIGNPYQVKVADETGSRLLLCFVDDFKESNVYHVDLSVDILDYSGNRCVQQQVDLAVPAQTQKGDMVINEVLFNPYPGGVDFVELWNVSDKMLDLGQLQLANRDEKYDIDESYVLAESHLLWMPGELLVLTKDSAQVVAQYPNCDPQRIMEVAHLPSFPDKTGRVIVLDYQGVILDELEYHERMHFALLQSVEGVSLERIHPNWATQDVANWHSAAQTVGFATPGMPNSVYSPLSEAPLVVQLKPQLFTPDNDGVDDQLEIVFSLGEPGYVANVNIYDAVGNKVCSLVNNQLLGQSSRFAWDGLIGNHQRAPLGIYVVYIQLHNTKGNVKHIKKTCVLAGRHQ